MIISKFFRLVILLVLLLPTSFALASTLSLSPATGVYTTGSTFTVKVVVNTKGAPINAADGVLSFNPKELQVVSVSRSSSIFNLWTTEPTFSNSAGSISFSGGSPTGYTGAAGTVMTVTFKTLGAGSPRVTMSSGSVLAADGKGTNVLTSMGSGVYTISAVTETPEPEAIVEYVPPANTPLAPKITSETHPDVNGWSKEKTAKLAWSVPGDVVAVRTLLDGFPNSIPTKVYDSPIKDITLENLDEGISYFHIQFKNSDGWGRVTHYRLGVDSINPSGFVLSLAPQSNLANPNQVIVATTSDVAGSPIEKFIVQLNGAEAFEVKNEKLSGEIALHDLKPGRQSLVVEAFDSAGNSAVSTFTFDIESFDAPRFTDVPSEINTGVVPVFSGVTRPKSIVTVTMSSPSLQPLVFEVSSDESGAFRVIPEGKLAEGVYTMSAVAKDEYGAQSQVSTEIKFVVRQSGLLRVGGLLINVLSILIPLLSLFVVVILGLVYLLARYKRFRKIIFRESQEAKTSLHEQFIAISEVLERHETSLVNSRKTKKLTTAEAGLIGDIKAVIKSAEDKVLKEVSDVTNLVDKS